MAFELSFGPEFFIGPHDLEGVPFPPDCPTTVYQALSVLTDEEWQTLADEAFGGASITVETVLQKIRETNTCRDLGSPVEVYIDIEGWHTVKVYDVKEYLPCDNG